MQNQIQDVYTLPSIMNFDNLFAVTQNPIILNSLLLEKSSDEIVEIICDVSTDKEDSVASCICGELSGNYYEGIKCTACGSFCTASLFNQIKNDIWLGIPNSISAVLNPQVYAVLNGWLGNIAKIPVLDAILDMDRVVEPLPGTPFFTAQGFNWFHENFLTVIEYFANSHPLKSKRALGNQIRAFIMKAGASIWCTKLPILSKAVQPISRHSDTVRYADPELKELMKAIFTLGSTLISEKMMKFTSDHIERNFFKVYVEFTRYTASIIKSKLPQKPSILRKHVFGTRYHFTARSVCIAMMGEHEADEIYLPWKLGVMLYKYHIISVLANFHSMTIFQANDKVMTAINVYDHTVDLIMQDLILQAPTKGLPMLLNRNPSLKLAAIQLVFVTKIKPALKINPFSMVSVTPNGHDQDSIIQFDGDEDGFATEYQLPDDEPTDRRGTGRRTSGRRQSDEVALENNYQYTVETVQRYIEDETIEVSPLIIRGPNIDLVH